MSRFLIVLAAVAPSLLMLSYAIAKTRGSWRSEAMWHAFFVGALSALAAVGIEFVLAGIVKLGHPSLVANAASTAIFVAAIPEEGIKFVVLILLAERHVEVRRLQDIIVLGVAVSLGFATVENFCYVAEPGKWQEVAAVRAVAAVPAHGIDGLMMGALLAAARLHPDRNPMRLIAALLVPIVSHAAYDFPAIAVSRRRRVGAVHGGLASCRCLFVDSRHRAVQSGFDQSVSGRPGFGSRRGLDRNDRLVHCRGFAGAVRRANAGRRGFSHQGR